MITRSFKPPWTTSLCLYFLVSHASPRRVFSTQSDQVVRLTWPMPRPIDLWLRHGIVLALYPGCTMRIAKKISSTAKISLWRGLHGVPSFVPPGTWDGRRILHWTSSWSVQGLLLDPHTFKSSHLPEREGMHWSRCHVVTEGFRKGQVCGVQWVVFTEEDCSFWDSLQVHLSRMLHKNVSSLSLIPCND